MSSPSRPREGGNDSKNQRSGTTQAALRRAGEDTLEAASAAAPSGVSLGTIASSNMETKADASNTPPMSTIGNVYFFGYSHFEDFNGVDLLSFVKEHNTTLTFPQKLMLMLTHVDRESAAKGKPSTKSCVSWTPDGNAFVIRDRKEFVDGLLPLFFRQAKFPSFTRKLYRWGFRQICIPPGRDQKDRDLYFGHEFFKRDDKSQMANMRSVTAAGTRRAIASLAANKKKRVEAEAAASALKKSDRKPRSAAVEAVGITEKFACLDPASTRSGARLSPTSHGSSTDSSMDVSCSKPSALLANNRQETTSQDEKISGAPPPGNMSFIGVPVAESSAALPPAIPSSSPITAASFLQSLASQNAPVQTMQQSPQSNSSCPGPSPGLSQLFPTMSLPGLFSNSLLSNPGNALLMAQMSQLAQNMNQSQLQADLATTALLMRMPQNSQLQNLSNAIANAQNVNNGSNNVTSNDAMRAAVDMLLGMNTNPRPPQP